MYPWMLISKTKLKIMKKIWKDKINKKWKSYMKMIKSNCKHLKINKTKNKGLKWLNSKLK
jgi:hypothetical protein